MGELDKLADAIDHLARAIDAYAETQWPVYKGPITADVEPWWNLPVTYTQTPDGTVMHLGSQVIESTLGSDTMTRLPG